mmetsp:Transcript_11869/g.32105  ORF Transcript_11869/g.32105 Transcript_11869/m.32105 type:complete len:94 (+) Transcript_11869:138-419(+)
MYVYPITFLPYWDKVETQTHSVTLTHTGMCAGSAGFEELLDEPKCELCGKDAEKRCSRCKTAWYCSRECQLAGWKKHKPFCQMVTDGGAAAKK